MQLSYTGSTAQAGLLTKTLVLGATTVGQAGTNLADVALSNGLIQLQGQVYNGQGVWQVGFTDLSFADGSSMPRGYPPHRR